MASAASHITRAALSFTPNLPRALALSPSFNPDLESRPPTTPALAFSFTYCTRFLVNYRLICTYAQNFLLDSGLGLPKKNTHQILITDQICLY